MPSGTDSPSSMSPNGPVFELTADGVELKEVAPGIDIQRDILSQMDFTPILKDVKTMDARIFREERMGLVH